MKKLLILILVFATVALSCTATMAQTSKEPIKNHHLDNNAIGLSGDLSGIDMDAFKKQHVQDSLNKILKPLPIDLTKAQFERLKTFSDSAIQVMQVKIMEERVKYIQGIIEAQKNPIDIAKVKEYDIRDKKLILKLSK